MHERKDLFRRRWRRTQRPPRAAGGGHHGEEPAQQTGGPDPQPIGQQHGRAPPGELGLNDVIVVHGRSRSSGVTGKWVPSGASGVQV